MIDLDHLEKYKENNRIEAKKALGGLPDSIWETYSAFANTLGGIILLGVEELPDRSLHAVDLPEPTYIVEDLWKIINDPKKVSMNILTEKDVEIENVDGKSIVVIKVPRAERYDKPIYIGGDPYTGTYRRNGEGDDRCTAQEVQDMLNDAGGRSQDMVVLENMDMEVFDYDSISSYRERMRKVRPAHVWEDLEDGDFLYKLGAVSRGRDGSRCPTVAGLLMFGHEYEIVGEFPDYFLDYREQLDDESSETSYRLVSSSGEWSGNLYDFYFTVYERIARDIRGAYENRAIHAALREALANCIINADYRGRQGLVIVKKRDVITFSNPGDFRIGVEAAKSGGVSDPRNSTLTKMFNLIGIGERSGSGIPNIYHIWDKQGWEAPIITVDHVPARTTMSLSVKTDDRPAGDSREVRISENDRIKIAELHKDTIIEYLTDHVKADASDLSELLGVRSSRVKKLLGELANDGIIVEDGHEGSGEFRLKEDGKALRHKHGKNGTSEKNGIKGENRSIELEEKFAAIQNELRQKINLCDNFDISRLKTVAGVDLAYWKNGDDEYAVCCIVVIDNETHEVIEKKHFSGKIEVPYIPGFLAFRELPLILKTVELLENSPDLYVFDGNGYLHPRHMGIATHASFYLKKPTIGIAKTYFRVDKKTDYTEPDDEAGSYTDIVIDGEVYGRALRTHKNVKPVFISVGNDISLDTACELALKLTDRESHIPVPTRFADLETHIEREAERSKMQ